MTPASGVSATKAAVYLDTALIERLRIERRLSVRTIETTVGVGGGWYQSLITGANHETTPMRYVARLADELGVGLADLLAAPITRRPGQERVEAPTGDEGPHLEADVRRLGSVLADLTRQVQLTTLARELGWTVQRLDYATSVLDRRLRGVGRKVIRGVSGIQIVRETTTADHAVAGAMADQLRQGGLTVTHVRLLARIARGEITRKSVSDGTLSNAQDVALKALTNAGLIVAPEGHRHSTYTLAEDVRTSLLT